jgi:hypothetical protein
MRTILPFDLSFFSSLLLLCLLPNSSFLEQIFCRGKSQCDQDSRTAASHDRWAKKYNKKVANNWSKYINATDDASAAIYHRKYEKYEGLATSEENAATALRDQIAARHP